MIVHPTPKGNSEYATVMRAHARRYWRKTLRATKGNVAHAARAAGINRTHAYQVLHSIGLQLESRRRHGNWTQHGL